MAELGIADGRCRAVVGRKFPGRHTELQDLLGGGGVYLLYPGPKAVSPSEAVGGRTEGAATFLGRRSA